MSTYPARRRASSMALIALVGAISGCDRRSQGPLGTGVAPPVDPSGRSDGQDPAAVAASPGDLRALDTPEEILETTDRPAARQRLVERALDPAASPQLRYTALRQLERWAAPEAVTVASELLAEEDPLLHQNAVAVIARSRSEEASALLARLSGEDRELAARVWQWGHQ